MKVLIQQLSSGLFLQTEDAWAREPEEAKVFSSSTAAMEFCLRRNIKDVGLLLSFDSGTEVVLEVFDRDELKEAVARALVENARLQEESRALIAMLDGIIAEGKERRKQRPFKPAKDSDGE